MNNSLIDKIIIFLLSIILIIDSFNGFLLLNKFNTGISLSQLVKFPLLYFMMFRIYILNKKYFLHVLGISMILVLAVFINYVDEVNVSLLKEFTLILKLLVIPICAYYFVSLKEINYDFYYKSIIKIFKISFIVLAVNIFLSIIGVGYSSYSGGIGNKGFFYAGNELSAMYLIISSFLLQYTFKKLSIKYYIILSIIALVIGVSISTKVSMFSIFLIIILIPLISVKIKINATFILKAVFFVLGIVLISALLYDNVVNSSVFDRWVYFFKVYNYDYTSIILSGRNKTLIESFNMNETFYKPINLFFGYSYTGFLDNMQQSTFYKVKANEMDFFDIYFIYGIFGLLSVLSIWFISIVQFIISEKKNLVLLITICLILVISFLSGHVLFSGLSGPFIGIYLSLMFHNKLSNSSNL